VSAVHARSNGGDGCDQGIGDEAVRASIVARILELPEWSNRIGDKGRRQRPTLSKGVDQEGKKGNEI
jgi:hypothetical protein